MTDKTTPKAVSPRPQLTTRASEDTQTQAQSVFKRVYSQSLYETQAMLTNGEQLLLTLIIPVIALLALVTTPLLDSFSNTLETTRVNIAVPGVLGLCALSTAFTGQAIQTGFDRRYGVLRFFATTPLGKSGLIFGKAIAVVIVLSIEVIIIGALGFILGWHPQAAGIVPAIFFLILAAVTFTVLGLLIAGTVRPEATLAITNLAWIVLLVLGGLVTPTISKPEWLSALVSILPTDALGEILRSTLIKGTISIHPVIVLIVWCVLGSWAAHKFFKWD